MNRDLAVALKIQADVAEAVKRLADVESGLESVAAAGNADMSKGLEQLVNAARSAREAGKVAGDAYASLGVRSDDDILYDIKAQEQAFEALRASGVASANDIARAQAAMQGRIQALNAELNRGAGATKGAAISAGQYQQAMRQLPMQITDVVTSLASGMPVWMVAIQQGGQIRDSFGGIGESIRAVMSLINPWTVALTAAAVVVGGLAVAAYQGADEADRLGQALIESGNYAGTTAGNLERLAATISGVTGRQYQAVDALEALAGSGKITESQMEKIGTASVAMSNATGRSIKSITDEFIKLADGGSKAARELSEKYNYLTQATYEQIKALEEQGRTIDAATLNMNAYADALLERAPQITNNLGTIEKAWKGLKDVAKSAWDAMLDIGRAPGSLSQQLAEAQRLAAQGGMSFGDRVKGVVTGLVDADAYDAYRANAGKNQAELNAEVARLQALVNAEAEAAKKAGERAAADKDGVRATDELNALLDKTASKSDKLKKDMKSFRESLEAIRKVNPGSELLLPANVSAMEKAIQDKYKTKAPKPKSDPVDTAYLSQQQSLTLALADAQNRLQNAKDGVAGADDKATTKLEAWLTVNKNALKLDDGRVQALRSLAEQTDAATRALAELTEAKKRDERITKGLADVDQGLAEAMGNTADAALRQIREKYRKLREDLTTAGNTEGLIRLDKLEGLESARAQLQQLQEQADKVFGAQGRAEQSISAQLEAGLLTEYEARERILGVHQQTYEQLQKFKPLLAELAQQPGAVGESATAMLQELQTQETRLLATTTLFASTVKEGLTAGLKEAIAGLADGTLTLKEAIHALATTVAQSLLNMYADQAAQALWKSVSGSVGGTAPEAAAGTAAAASMGTSITTAAAASASTMGASITAATATGATSMSTGISTAGVSAGTAMGTAITSAGAAAATTMATAISTANALGAANAVGSVGGDALGAFIGAMGFADGGWTGPGGKYQPAGIVHAGEFVNRQEVVRQPGALAFLYDFNALGMAALERWATFKGYASGGFVGPALPSYTPTATAPVSASTTLNNQLALNLIDDPERIASVLASPRGDKAFTVLLSRDPAKYRQILRIE